MKVEIKDKDKNIVKALNMLGYKLDSKNLEIILNISDFVKDKGGSSTINDLTEIESLVKGLYED